LFELFEQRAELDVGADHRVDSVGHFARLAVSTNHLANVGTVAARWCLLIRCCLRRSPSPLLG
jgi:hypothetical protein